MASPLAVRLARRAPAGKPSLGGPSQGKPAPKLPGKFGITPGGPSALERYGPGAPSRAYGSFMAGQPRHVKSPVPRRPPRSAVPTRQPGTRSGFQGYGT